MPPNIALLFAQRFKGAFSERPAQAMSVLGEGGRLVAGAQFDQQQREWFTSLPCGKGVKFFSHYLVH